MRNIYALFCLANLVAMLLLPGKAYSQEDTIFRPSLRLGIELSYPARMIIEPETRQYEASLDYEFANNWFANAEGGILEVDIGKQDFDYFTEGWFFRTGIDYNVLGRNTLKDNDIVYFGLRYGFSRQNQGAENIILADDYWGSYTTSLEQSALDIHWMELAGGVKTELFTNIFIGWSLRFRVRLTSIEDLLIKPYRVSGFGRGDKNTALDVNYSIFYRIPI